MGETPSGEIGSYCMNEACEDYQKIRPEHVTKFGQTERGIQRYRCKTCKKTFTATKGTLLYRLRHSEEEIAECMAILSESNSLAAIHRIKGIKAETVGRWIEKLGTPVPLSKSRYRRPRSESGMKEQRSV